MRSEDIKPISDHRAHLTQDIRQVQETGRPLFVTSNGKPAAIVLSPDTYDALMAKAELADRLAMIDSSLDDIEKGKVVDARQALKDIAAKHGLRNLG